MSSPDSISASIIICTHNRCALLENLITSLCGQSYPPDAYEVIFVDNASTDDTRTKIECLIEQSAHPIRYIYEPQLGVSNARNQGAAVANGEIFAYIDDDAIPEPDWLAKLVDGLTSKQDIVCVGGKIDLMWDVPRPDWMPKELEGYLGDNTQWGDICRELDKSPHEGNMAAWRWAIQAAGGFDTRFGGVGNKLGRNEGPRLYELLRRQGKILYTPDAVVHHRVPAVRATKRYLIRLGFFQGIANGNLSFLGHPRSRIGLIRSFLADIKFLAQEAAMMIQSWLQKDQRKAFANRVFMIIRLGQMWQTLRLVFRV